MNDATSVVIFNAIQSFDLTHLNHEAAFHLLGNFLYLFLLSTLLGVAVSPFFFLFAILSWLLCSHHLKSSLFILQTGLISAYVIKKLYFGRYIVGYNICESVSISSFPGWSKVDVLLAWHVSDTQLIEKLPS